MIRSPLLSLLFVSLIPCLSAQSSVWKVTKGSNEVYLGGTCHILRASDFPLPPEFDLAYAQADTLVFEIDPSEMESPAFAARLMAESVYRDGRTLKTVLSEEAYGALAAQGAKSNLPIEILQNTKPGMAVMMITIQELTMAGITQEGVDLLYARKAKRDGKPVGSLETVEFQLNLITNLGEGNESAFVLYSMQDLEQIGTLFDEIVRAWRTGDLETIDQFFAADMEKFPGIYEIFLKDRNERWVPRIADMLENEPTEFVLVGVGHMGGQHGLLSLLRAEGYSIEQVATE
ncbi:MAG: TraB/GumN family protein [Verrucomicrobia bacterium]|jgi:uncharacterized protein YbaP (TraB family)|nr:TraB/GumN family protein [Verrucomicrobiota bacterium]